MGRRGLRANNANRVPGSELRRQFIAILIVREGTQVGVCIRFENEDSHGSVSFLCLGGSKINTRQGGLKMALSNWAFAMTFATAVVGCLLAILIVWYRRPKQDG